jgi:uncharacterized protein
LKILIDIGHPAHVHLFKNLAFDMQKNGHEFLFTVREGEHQAKMLSEYRFNYTVIGRKKTGPIRKILGILIFSYRILKAARHFKPDLFLSHGSMYAGYAAFLTGKAHIALEDTGNMEQLYFSRPVSDVILSPVSLKVHLGRKHIFYNGFHELAYLHPKRFSPDKSVLNEIHVREDEPFVILRFISWNATHDFGHLGLSVSQKRSVITEARKIGKVFISSEKPLPAEFEEFALRISPHRLHHLLYFATLYIGEGATTASECAMLGTPAIYVNTISAGTLEQQERDGLLFCFHNPDGLNEKIHELMTTPDLKDEFRKRRDLMLRRNIDVTSFLIWFIENFPESRNKMNEDPNSLDSFL